MQQRTFGAANFEKYGKQTRKAKFLEEMNRVIPWQELVEPYYPLPPGAGRRPVGPAVSSPAPRRATPYRRQGR